uniref:G_PROTEIN_RECEP_F1_2 domain-containing protein n=1 Tax=Angiostrongylus cantonensis TaxID=6313 RepID=A0A0K0CWE4_ANGCA
MEPQNKEANGQVFVSPLVIQFIRLLEMVLIHILGKIASLSLFFVSLVVNAFFIYIVHSKTRQETGTYKYVLMLFALCNIVFSTSELISKPVKSKIRLKKCERKNTIITRFAWMVVI